MKKQIKQLKKVLHKNKEDLQYLLFAGIPTAIFYWVLTLFVQLGEVY
jgi:hypothetical protein